MLWSLGCPAFAADFFVSIAGCTPYHATNCPGTRAAPLAVTTIFGTTDSSQFQPSFMTAGDTVWLRAGTYTGPFWSGIAGTANSRVRVAAYPGETVILSGGACSGCELIAIHGAYCDYVGLVQLSTVADRSTLSSGSVSPFVAGAALYAVGSRIINNVIHDTAQGVTMWGDAPGAQIYGTLNYNNGWEAPDGTHGHSAYYQNLSGAARSYGIQNIYANSFESRGIHIYAGAAGVLTNITLDSNVSIGNPGLVGGESGVENFEYLRNHSFSDAVNFYYTSHENTGLTLSGNVFLHRLDVKWWLGAVISNNKMLGGFGPSVVSHAAGTQADSLLANNSYFGNIVNHLVYVNSVGTQTIYGTLAEAQAAGFEAGSTDNPAPTGFDKYYYQNAYEPLRCHVVVYNWGSASSGTLDLSQCGYVSGDQYEIWDMQALGDASPLHAGIYSGSAVTVNLGYAGFTQPTGTVVTVFTKTPITYRAYLIRAKQTWGTISHTWNVTGLGVTSIRHTYGYSPTLLDQITTTVACSTTCSVSIPARVTRSLGLYEQWQYLNGSGVTLAQSMVQQATVN